MTLPDFRGFLLEGQIHAAGTRIIILWFSNIDHELESWRQIQVTLVGARLTAASVEIGTFFPPLRSCEISEKATPRGNRTQIAMTFDQGEMSFECEELVWSEFSRQVRFVRETGQ